MAEISKPPKRSEPESAPDTMKFPTRGLKSKLLDLQKVEEEQETRKFPTRRVGEVSQEVPSEVPAEEEAPEGTLPRGTVLQNRYEIMKILGVGGMGAVYLAHDQRFSGVTKPCAVKEMISATPDPRLRQISITNFEREANILASLSHPSIPNIFDYFSEEDRSYLVLEFIDGKDLEAILQESTTFLSEEQVLEWAVQICDVLSYLHGHQPNAIVFRDLKPSNIMLNKSNLIVLIDFGIAKAFETGKKGTMIGTEGYSPPEQYRGVAGPQGDIYALGATLHHLLTKRDPRLEPPFTFHERLPRSINPEVSEATEAVIMKALEYDMEKRFASALEVRQALLGILPAKERPAISIPTAAITAPHEVQCIWKFVCEDEVRSSPRVSEEGMLYIGAYDNNLYALDSKTGEFIWKYPTEGGIPSTPCLWQDRVFIGSEDNIFYAIYTRTGRIAWSCPTGDRIRSSACVAYEHVFFGSDDRQLYALNAKTGRVVWKFEAVQPIRSSPDVLGETVFFGSEDRTVYALNIGDGRVQWKNNTNRGVTSSPAFYEDRLVIIGSSDWNVYALDVQSGWPVWRYRTNKPVISSPAVFGKRVFIGSVDGHMYALDARSGRVVWKYETEGPITSSPTVAADAVYFGSTDGYVYSLEAKTGKLWWRFQTEGPIPSSPTVFDGIVYIGSTDHSVYALPV
jgi:outer membrane protein assembly factor BamB/tRNA A-37 threonylcarbamoyl transferase component Bud32